MHDARVGPRHGFAPVGSPRRSRQLGAVTRGSEGGACAGVARPVDPGCGGLQDARVGRGDVGGGRDGFFCVGGVIFVWRN